MEFIVTNARLFASLALILLLGGLGIARPRGALCFNLVAQRRLALNEAA